MSNPDRLEDLLRRSFDLDLNAEPAPVPAELRARVLQNANSYSSELLGERLREAAGLAGLTVEDVTDGMGSQSAVARDLIMGRGDPRTLPSRLWAKLFARIGLDPRTIAVLFRQTVAGHTVFTRPSEAQVFGRTKGLSDEERVSALSLGEVYRDPVRAGREAANFLDEVIEAWQRHSK